MILYPKAHFNNVKEISIEFLEKNNIKALILDVDNTLIDYDRNMPDGTVEWVEQLKNNGIKFYIVSNTNKKDKVEQVSQKLKIKYNYFAKKTIKNRIIKGTKRITRKARKCCSSRRSNLYRCIRWK